MKFLSFLCVAIPAISTLIAFDRLVKIQHKFHHTDWVNDRRPNGLFWVADENQAILDRLNSSVATRRCALTWLVPTPEWIKRDSRATRALLIWRLLVVLWAAAFLGTLILAFK
jgi:hypothetical protein